jgi:D-arabinonate dehydratase/D-galactarolactone cycloisomerase
MKITGVETICLHYRMPYALTYPRGEYQEREALLVKVHTDESGLFGWGESAVWGGPWATSVAVIEKEIAPLIVGLDPRQPEYIWERVYQQTYYHGRKGILLACLSGIDIALWDIIGRSANQPVWRLLGGYGRPLRTYASSGYYRRNYSKEDLARDIGKARKDGYLGYKMKVGNIAGAIHARTLH